MILCSNPGCQTTAGCICDRVGRSPAPYQAIDEYIARRRDIPHPHDATISQLQAEIARLREAVDRGARLALSAENFCHRFTMNDLAGMDDQQRNAVLDQIKLFREGARAALGGSNDQR